LLKMRLNPLVLFACFVWFYSPPACNHITKQTSHIKQGELCERLSRNIFARLSYYKEEEF
jgi:hypothetical protein